MAISYPVSLPSGVPGPKRISFRMNSIVGASRSPFTGAQQVYAHAGQFWSAEVELPPMERADAEEWIAFLASLNGMEGTFLMGDPVNTTARGAATGTPLVKGASQTGNTLTTDGWTAGVTGILKAGDWIQLGTGSTSTLHKLQQAATSDGTGEAVLEIWPGLRTAPADNAVITVASCKGLWRLASNEQGYDIGEAQIYGIAFNCVEAF